MPGADVLVIGAGCVGASVAYRLAERGAAVTVLDAGAPGGGTSGASFAWTNSFNKTPRDYHDLNVAGMEEHAGLAKELGGGWLHQDGALAWDEGPGGLARLREAVDRLTGWGYPVERISPRQARELEPDLRIADAVAQVVWTPGEGYVEAVPFIGALLAEAVRRGARMLPGRRVTDVIRSGARVRGVSTEVGDRFEADVVVDCAGAAADEIARLAGVTLPIDRVPGRLIYTAPVTTTLRRPIHAPGCHFRPAGGGRIVLAEGAHDQTYAEGAEPWPAERSLATVAAHLPVLAGARVEATRIGVRPMPRDERPMVGAIPGLDGFYVVASHSGVTLGPLWGRIATAEILDGAMDARLTPYRPARFL
ncbi:MAG TPA: FAD-dependent oxidoreductase [Methylomirabilota bacterium]|nr:FAD-dependent oxidoreductase [Methylomirabilota bacterium]